MHPYRPLYVTTPEPSAARDTDAVVAYAVMSVAGSVPLVVPGVPLAQTVFGGACAVAGVWLLVRSRATASASSQVRSLAPSACRD